MSRGLPSDWSSRRRKVLERDNFTCANCERKGGQHGEVELEVHHIVEREHGGTHELSNLKTLCSECHASVTHDQPAPTYHSNFDTSRSGNFGSRKVHLIIFLLIGWWTLGFANLLYAFYKHQEDELTWALQKLSGGIKSTEKRVKDYSERTKDLDERAGDFEERVENLEEKSEEVIFNGCPVCGGSMEMERKIPPAIASCSFCDAKMKQKVGAIGFVARYTLVEGESERVGETHKVTEWRNIGP